MTEQEPSPVAGEVLSEDTQERLRYAMQKVQQEGMLTAQLAAKISRSPFFNQLTKKRIESAREVVRAENELMGELRTHQLTKDRLLNLGAEIAAQRASQEADRAVAEARLVREKSGAAIAELEAQVRQEQLKAQLAALKKANEGVGDNKSQEQRYQEQLEAEAKKTAFEVQRTLQQAQQKVAVRRALSAERDRMIAEIQREARGNLSPAQEFEIETLQDVFRRFIDEA